ncbi:MAG TPA: YqzL family protein [Candidatus Avamphibacillus intestinigallinarum]|nr:YqzL family protein [Candidatus Avamphibacillus intestinigallinarum]
MKELAWKKFQQTGCVETYLLLKELEEQDDIQFNYFSEQVEHKETAYNKDSDRL